MTAALNLRWQCPRGHFVAEDDIRSYDQPDPFSYYGVRPAAEYLCRGCVRDGDPYMYFEMPRLVEVGATP